MDLQNLKKLYDGDPVSRAILDNLMAREQKVLKVKRFKINMAKAGQKYEETDIIKAFKELGLVGLGQYTGGAEARIEWIPKTWEILKDFFSQTGKLENTKEDESISISNNNHLSPNVSALESYDFPLRPNLKSHLKLPIDITVSEANRLAEFIKSLPIERSANY